MKLVIQRVKQAQVVVEGETIGAIGQGLLVLLGIHRSDSLDTTIWYVNKLLNLRIFPDVEGKMNRSIKDVEGGVLVVSQFTLYADCSKGRRPAFIDAAQPEIAIPIYEKFVSEVRQEMGNVATGKFGASMDVSLINDGPVTIVLEESASICK
jgi:D-aminoacyl-tRNA deacylase